MAKFLSFLKRLVLYLVGMSIIAIGINFSKLSGMGISPVSSIPGVLDSIFKVKFPGNPFVEKYVTLGTMVIIIYCLLVLAQILVLRSKFRWINILGIPVAWIFGFMVDFFGIDPHAFGHLLAGIPHPTHLVIRILYLLASILIIGIGVFVYLKPKLVPMPAEGLAAAFAEALNKAFGNCKTFVDVSLILIASILQLIFLGGFASFGIGKGVVGIGTILAAVCVGQVVKLLNRLYNKLFEKKEDN